MPTRRHQWCGHSGTNRDPQIEFRLLDARPAIGDGNVLRGAREAKRHVGPDDEPLVWSTYSSLRSSGTKTTPVSCAHTIVCLTGLSVAATRAHTPGLQREQKNLQSRGMYTRRLAFGSPGHDRLPHVGTCGAGPAARRATWQPGRRRVTPEAQRVLRAVRLATPHGSRSGGAHCERLARARVQARGSASSTLATAQVRMRRGPRGPAPARARGASYWSLGFEFIGTALRSRYFSVNCNVFCILFLTSKGSRILRVLRTIHSIRIRTYSCTRVYTYE